MALSTYAELLSSVGQWMERADISGDAADFVRLAEARLTRRLPLREMWSTSTLTGVVGSRAIPLPADFVEPSHFKRVDGDSLCALTPFTPDTLPARESVGAPWGWAVDVGSITLDKPCDQAYSFRLRYRKKFALSEAAPTNWLLTNHPDVYLAAVLVWGGLFVKEAPEAATWRAILDEAIDELSWIESRGDALAPLQFDPALASRRSSDLTRD